MDLSGLKESHTTIRDALTVRPFKCKGFQSGDQADVSFPVYRELEEEKLLQVPKFWALDFFKIPRPSASDLEHVIQEDAFEGSLRDFQRDIVDGVLQRMKEEGGGILSAQCGQGKTVMAIYILCQLRLKTLIVVNKQSLLSQWKERIAMFAPSLGVGVIQQKKVDIDGKPVVLGMLQSLSSKEYPQSVYEAFDFLVVDEVHNIATRTFSRTLLKICPQYTLGLSATPQRPDGTSRVFHWFLGPMLYKLSTKEISAKSPAGVLVQMVNYKDSSRYKFREIKNAKGDVLLSIMISNISELPERNRMIVTILLDILKKSPSRSVLVLSSRITQLRGLREDFERRRRQSDDGLSEVKTSMYVGSMKSCELQEALVDSQVLFGSYELISEGFDYPRLNTLILATPRSRVEQAVGRILRRRDAENPPLVVDVVDDLPSFKAQGVKRSKFYRSMGYNVVSSQSSDAESKQSG